VGLLYIFSLNFAKTFLQFSFLTQKKPRISRSSERNFKDLLSQVGVLLNAPGFLTKVFVSLHATFKGGLPFYLCWF